MLETPEARARLRRKLELCPDYQRSPVSINAGLELLDMVEKQERMVDWLAEQASLICDCVENCDECRLFLECGCNGQNSKEVWREAARRAVEGK